jgi:hypothetical protein
MDMYIRGRYHPSMVLWSLSNEILWPHSVESSSYFRLIEQVSLVGGCFVQSDFYDRIALPCTLPTVKPPNYIPLFIPFTVSPGCNVQ